MDELINTEFRNGYNLALIEASRIVSSHAEAIRILNLEKKKIVAEDVDPTQVFNMVAQAIAEPIRQANG